MFFVFSLLVAAADPQGSAVTTSSSVKPQPQADRASVAEVGVAYNLTVAATSQTNYWAGIYGNITGEIKLRGASNRSIFDWSIGAMRNQSSKNYYPLLFAYNGTSIPLWSSLSGNPFSGAAIDSLFSIESSRADSGSNTFTGAPTSFVVGNKSINAGAGGAARLLSYRVTDQASRASQEVSHYYETQVLNDTSGNALFASILRPIDQNMLLFDNASQGNFQMILFSNSTNSGQVPNYEFYLQLE
ncbi:hypothetical protein HZC09_02535 [Candidatus Micrarchaeota archaeon]|nr:hypothetical protein [Candidatus Micrarchaeota archaeon]